MIIKGAKVYTEEGTFADKEVCITGEVFYRNRWGRRKSG